jgi:two-component system vancomycin resistance associated response regulator VraR
MREGLILSHEREENRMKLQIALMEEYSLALQEMYDNLKVVPDFDIVGAFSSEEELLACLKEKTVDIVIVDLMLKENKGIALLEKIHSTQEQKIKIIALIPGKYDRIWNERGLELGVKAFLLKDVSIHELINVIISVGKGNDVIPDRMMESKQQQILSDMEQKVLSLVVQEYTNDKIAKELFLSRRTVETYVSSICSKLGVDGRVGAAREAIRLKLI